MLSAVFLLSLLLRVLCCAVLCAEAVEGEEQQVDAQQLAAAIRSHPSTDGEIKELCSDLQVGAAGGGGRALGGICCLLWLKFEGFDTSPCFP
jgi:hypothetical protein